MRIIAKHELPVQDDDPIKLLTVLACVVCGEHPACNFGLCQACAEDWEQTFCPEIDPAGEGQP